ncbi:MAG: cyclic nucleotide-binding domain-containing protein [candidate division NC10 bacterium]|nr:cyclic nucleotide-binding domain-containing protein [candidate division NC10 bacterium]
MPWSTLLEGLSPAEQAEVARRCAERVYRKGQVIFAVGDAPDALYLLREGWVKLRLLSREGRESIVQMFRPGDVFGEILLAVPERAFEAVALAARRLARALLRLGEQEGEATPDGRVRLPRPVTHETLGNLIGTSRETVSMQMRRFARAGLLGYAGRHLLLRTERLRSFLASPSRPPQRSQPRLRRERSRVL